MVERAAESTPFDGINPLNMEPVGGLGLNSLMKALPAAAADENIEGILLNMGAFSAGYGGMEEFVSYLKAFKESGKKVYAYGEFLDQKGAAIAAHADSSVVHPGGGIDWRGIGINSMYYKSFFEKWGIEPVVVRGSGNDFKSAVEPYIADEMSDANRLQLKTLIAQFWDFLTVQFEHRNVSRATLDQLAANWGTMNPENALEAGMIDALGYREDMMSHLEDNYNMVHLEDYIKTIRPTKSKNRIAVVYANGTITNGGGDMNTIGTANIINALQEASDDDQVKAIVLRVNSPGGSALTSDMIHHTIAGIEKPVIVSQGNYAASGGYYISCNADKIFTNKTTVTGSIGIFMSFFTGEKLMTETLGLKFEEVTTHPLANFPNLYKEPTPEAYAILQTMIDRGYEDFTGKVAAGRDTSLAYIKTIAKGRVWTGADALSISLADTTGTLSDAIAYAAEVADLRYYKITELPKPKEPLEEFLELMEESATSPVLQEVSRHPGAQEILYLIQNPGMQAKLSPHFSQF